MVNGSKEPCKPFPWDDNMLQVKVYVAQVPCILYFMTLKITHEKILKIHKKGILYPYWIQSVTWIPFTFYLKYVGVWRTHAFLQETYACDFFNYSSFISLVRLVYIIKFAFIFSVYTKTLPILHSSCKNAMYIKWKLRY